MRIRLDTFVAHICYTWFTIMLPYWVFNLIPCVTPLWHLLVHISQLGKYSTNWILSSHWTLFSAFRPYKLYVSYKSKPFTEVLKAFVSVSTVNFSRLHPENSELDEARLNWNKSPILFTWHFENHLRKTLFFSHPKAHSPSLICRYDVYQCNTINQRA